MTYKWKLKRKLFDYRKSSVDVRKSFLWFHIAKWKNWLTISIYSFVTSQIFNAKRQVFTKWRLIFFQHVDEENCYLCGYLKITGLTSEFPTLTTFFDAEIVGKRYPFLTRKWDADEDVDRKHWVSSTILNVNNFPADKLFSVSGTICSFRRLPEELQLRWFYLRRVREVRLRVHALERTFPRARPHDPRH